VYVLVFIRNVLATRAEERTKSQKKDKKVSRGQRSVETQNE